MQRLSREFSQPFEIMVLLTSDCLQISLHDLQTKYNTEDLYDLLEMVDAVSTIREDANKLPDNK